MTNKDMHWLSQSIEFMLDFLNNKKSQSFCRTGVDSTNPKLDALLYHAAVGVILYLSLFRQSHLVQSGASRDDPDSKPTVLRTTLQLLVDGDQDNIQQSMPIGVVNP